MITILYSERFKKHYRKLTNIEKNQFEDKTKRFLENPLNPSLRTKKIQGCYGLFEFSVNMDIRVIWFYSGNDIIMFFDIGHHDILNGY